jgi:RNA polymerase sigma factor (sigma-70 family)
MEATSEESSVIQARRASEEQLRQTPLQDDQAGSGPRREELTRDLVERYQGEIDRFVRSKLQGDAEAQDVAQQTMLQALGHLDSLDPRTLRAWIYTTARRLIVDRYRQRARFPGPNIDEVHLHKQEHALQTAEDGVQATCDARARLRCCLSCISGRLPIAEQVAILLSDVYGYADREAAIRMGATSSTFKFILHKARRHLHEEAGRHQPGNSCPLVSKTGVRAACPGCDHGPTIADLPQRRHGFQPRPLDEPALATLRDRLVGGLNTAWARTPA